MILVDKTHFYFYIATLTNNDTFVLDQSYSVMDNMTTGLKMSKLFSKSHYDAVRMTEPYWLKGSEAIDPRDVTLTTAVTLDTWAELERIAERWQGKLLRVVTMAHWGKGVALNFCDAI